jgi:hypothetical protein
MSETKHLYRVWLGWSTESDGNRDELLRILANSFEDAADFAKNKLVKKEFHDQLSDEDFGFMWDEHADECDCPEDEMDFCPHWTSYYIQLDEIEDYTEDDLSLNLLTETLGSMDCYHDITTPS